MKKEDLIQAEIVRYLQSIKIFCHSVPNEAPGNNAIRAMQFISMGLRPGVGDLVVWWPNAERTRVTLGYLEIKRPDGRQSKSQENFEKRCKDAGVVYEIARSVEEVQELVRQKGINA